MKKVLYIPLLFLFTETYSQCSGGSNGGSITPTTSWQTITVSAGNYYTFTVAAGSCDTYDFSFCQGGGSASFDSQITLRTNADVYANSYNDDNCGLASQVLGFTPASSGTYRVLINNYYCAASGATATLAYKKNAPGSNANYQYLSNATSSGNCITLTAASNNQTGCAWDVNSTLNFTANFTYDFTVNLGSSDAGADGMAFVIQNDPAGRCKCGTAGGSMGAGGITNSLTVEIDTYLNTEDRDDGMTGVLCSGGPEPDHLDIWLNGVINPEYGSACVTDGGERVVASAVRLMSGASIYNIENGANHILRIAWNSATSTLTATVFNASITTSYGSISYTFNPITVFGTNTPYFGFTASTGGLNNQQSYCLPNVLLPVEITSFTALCDGKNVKVEWTSVSENQNSYYQLDRSFDGEIFETVAMITGAGNSSQLLQYAVSDEAVEGKEVFYRLSQTDFNGETRFIGNLLSVNCSGIKNDFSIVPNPAGENVQLILKNAFEKNAAVFIYDITGKQVMQSSIEAGSFSQFIDISHLSKGAYNFVLQYDDQFIHTDRLMIMR